MNIGSSMLPSSTSLLIEDVSQVGEARRCALALAHAHGFDAAESGKIAIVVAEAAGNILRHAQRGELLLRALQADDKSGIEILALDKGPGMTNVAQCLQDGYSTAGTPGTGLGAIRRLAATFDLYSLAGQGTALLAQLWAGPPPEEQFGNEASLGIVNLPKPGQEMCGDAWAVKRERERALFLLADGLGHGPEAAQASQEAVRVFRREANRRPQEILQSAHAALHGTRGAAAAIVEVDLNKRVACFAGIGNISGTLAGADQSAGLVSHNGIVGHQMRKVQEFAYPCPPDCLLILHSDGIGTHWRLDAYPGLAAHHPALIAGVLCRDYRRGNDDATFLIARCG